MRGARARAALADARAGLSARAERAGQRGAGAGPSSRRACARHAGSVRRDRRFRAGDARFALTPGVHAWAVPPAVPILPALRPPRPRSTAAPRSRAVVIGLVGLGLVVAGGWLIAARWLVVLPRRGPRPDRTVRGCCRAVAAPACCCSRRWSRSRWRGRCGRWGSTGGRWRARGDVFFVLGLFLLTPWWARARAARRQPASAARAACLGVVLAAVPAGGGASRGPAIRAASVGMRRRAAECAASAWPRARRRPEGRVDRLWRHRLGPALLGARPDHARPMSGSSQEAWSFRTGDVRGQPGDPEETTFEVTPLKIGERLFSARRTSRWWRSNADQRASSSGATRPRSAAPRVAAPDLPRPLVLARRPPAPAPSPRARRRRLAAAATPSSSCPRPTAACSRSIPRAASSARASGRQRPDRSLEEHAQREAGRCTTRPRPWSSRAR